MSSSPTLGWADRATLHNLLRALPFPAAVVSARGIILATNEIWDLGFAPESLWGAGLGSGIDYAEVLATSMFDTPSAFAIRHALGVAAAGSTAQAVDYENETGRWRARVNPIPDGGGDVLLWHESRSTPDPREHTAWRCGTPSRVALHETRPHTARHTPPSDRPSARSSSPAAQAQHDAMECLSTVLGDIARGTPDPMLALHQAHAGALLLSQLAARSSQREHADALRLAIEQELRAAAAGATVNWRCIRSPLERCLEAGPSSARA